MKRGLISGADFDGIGIPMQGSFKLYTVTVLGDQHDGHVCWIWGISRGKCIDPTASSLPPENWCLADDFFSTLKMVPLFLSGEESWIHPLPCGYFVPTKVLLYPQPAIFYYLAIAPQLWPNWRCRMMWWIYLYSTSFVPRLFLGCLGVPPPLFFFWVLIFWRVRGPGEISKIHWTQLVVLGFSPQKNHPKSSECVSEGC